MADVAEGFRSGILKSKQLVPFQADGVITSYMRDGHMLVWDCGAGKSVGAIALSALCDRMGKADHVLVVCEQNKIREWVEDFQADTDLSTRAHHGAGRQKRLERLGVPQVLVTTYETAKSDCAVKAGPRSYTPGDLLTKLIGKKVLVIFDEMTRLKNRSSANYQTHEFILRTLRKRGETKVLALTATPIEKDYEDGFNQLRLIVPKAMPTVKVWEAQCVASRDPYGRARYNPIGVEEWLKTVQPHITRKRKTDPDVIAQFPPLIEEYRYIELSNAHRDLYRTIEKVAVDKLARDDDASAYMALRQIAGHPYALVHSAAQPDGSAMAKEIVKILGADHLRSIPSAKTEALKTYLHQVIAVQDAKAMVFTFFGQSVLRCLEQELSAVGLPVYTFHGGKTAAENEKAKQGFKNHPTGAVLLSSDSGARGINVPEATYVIEYESALKHALRLQRMNRAHRFNSTLGPVTATTFIAAETIEEDIFKTVLDRNKQHDKFTGDDGSDVEEEFVTASDRRAIMEAARARITRKS